MSHRQAGATGSSASRPSLANAVKSWIAKNGFPPVSPAADAPGAAPLPACNAGHPHQLADVVEPKRRQHEFGDAVRRATVERSAQLVNLTLPAIQPLRNHESVRHVRGRRAGTDRLTTNQRESRAAQSEPSSARRACLCSSRSKIPGTGCAETGSTESIVGRSSLLLRPRQNANSSSSRSVSAC